jgi:dephospho-CoA kinase
MTNLQMQPEQKFIVGVTGGIGSGKTTVTNMFAEKQIDIVDADLVARDLVVPGSEGLLAIEKHFGKSVLNAKGALDRSMLRQIIFADEQKKLLLNNLLHPLIRQEMLNQLAQTSSQYAILSAPLLFENGLDKWVNRSLAVDISEETQLQRTLARDGGNSNTVKNIISSQISRKDRLEKADDIIDNSKDIADLAQQVERLHKQYLDLSADGN